MSNNVIVFRKHHAVITGVSDMGINQSTDGSSFSIPLERAPLNIPSHAVNMTAKLIKAQIKNTYTPLTSIPNPILIETSFTQGGINQEGNVSTLLALVPHKYTESIIYTAPKPAVQVSCNRALSGENPQNMEFRLIDKNGQPVEVDSSGSWCLQLVIEWEQEVKKDYLRTDLVESQYY